MKIFDIVKGVAECTTEILFELFSGETSSTSNSNNTSIFFFIFIIPTLNTLK